MLRTGNSGQISGFTLIEVLVAMVILSISLLAAIKVASEVTNSAIYLQDKTIAQWVAMNKMVEIQLAKQIPNPGKSNGEDEMAGRDWRWDIEVSKSTFSNEYREVRIGVKPASDDPDSAPTILLVSFVGKL